MSDPQPTRPQGHESYSSRTSAAPAENKRGILGRLAGLITHAPENRSELRKMIALAKSNGVINDETQVMIDGVVRLADKTTADAMALASRVDMIDIDTPVQDVLDIVIDTGHSRFPVYESTTDDEDENRQNIIGVLMAKDLIKLGRSPELNMRALLRQPFFVPERRTLNQMLSDFRTHHQHMALVVDEFGRFSGVLTIEDVLEEIVGEIEDEFDVHDDDGDIYVLADNSFRVAGDTSLERINEAFNMHLESEDVETIGGYISHELSHVPRRGEACVLGDFQFTVLHTSSGAVRWFRVVAAGQAGALTAK